MADSGQHSVLNRKGYEIKTQSNYGYLELEEIDSFSKEKILNLMRKSSICINLIGILYEKGKINTFKNIHENFPNLLSALCKEYNLKQFIHISALGINESLESKYAKSKLDGELKILKYYPTATILRPSIVYSSSDNFTTNFMTLLKYLPVFPLYYSGKTKFMPIHCSDLTDVIFHIISKDSDSQIIECIGPEILTFKEIIELLLKLINKK